MNKLMLMHSVCNFLQGLFLLLVLSAQASGRLAVVSLYLGASVVMGLVGVGLSVYELRVILRGSK